MTGSPYLRFGGADAAEGLQPAETLTFLREKGFADGYLSRARHAVATHARRRFSFEPMNAGYCDFCFMKLMGGEYDRLKDGRERCMRCSRTVVRTGEDFRELYESTKRTMEIAFGVSIKTALRVRMVNAREIARKTGERFEPTPGVDARVLGFAEKARDGYSLYIENGTPKLAAIATIAHELTHIWQYLNWDVKEIEDRYGAHHRLAVYEGMATWAQIQYLLFLREYEDAERHEAYALQRRDEYGVGFRVFVDRYPLARDGDLDADSPFAHRYPL
ncbi:hypothetical protein ACFQZV_05370 [Microbacterium koreense]|uniref:Uncharacterized protein n=1 Tax=Microbacterium koreense TaxID=323761 RepID=A0ABW2ZQ34_9MICO